MTDSIFDETIIQFESGVRCYASTIPEKTRIIQGFYNQSTRLNNHEMDVEKCFYDFFNNSYTASINTDANPEGTFVDIGARFGYYCFYTEMLAPQVKIMAYDMDEHMINCIKKNSGLNESKNIYTFNAEVSKKSIPLTQVIEDAGGTIDLLRIDISGDAVSVLKSGKQSLSRCIKNIVVGTQPGTSEHRETMYELQKHDFRIVTDEIHYLNTRQKNGVLFFSSQEAIEDAQSKGGF